MAFTKIVKFDKHPWFAMGQMMKKRSLFDRLKRVYNLFSNLDIGPKIYDISVKNGNLYITMEHIPHTLNDEIIESRGDEIQFQISFKIGNSLKTYITKEYIMVISMVITLG
jgi:hypothetical protein